MSYVYHVHRGLSSHLLKHSSAVSRSRRMPPPPTMLGRSPPTHSASSRTHPAPDLDLEPVLVLVPEVPLEPPPDLRGAGVQNPSPVPQYPALGGTC